jgi:hypothetical protein
MDNWDKRVQATVFVWLAVGLAVGLSGLNNPANGNTVVVAAIMATVAFLSTAVIWVLGGEGGQVTRKAKRRAGDDARLAALLHLLDENERDSLKQQLLSDLAADGEMLSLGDLLATQRRDSN